MIVAVLAGTCVGRAALSQHSSEGAPPALAGDWRQAESAMLGEPVQLTFPERFAKAGEAYFSPDGRRVIFQAVEAPKGGEEASPFYCMYVADLSRTIEGKAFALENIRRVSPQGSANTCGWFDPVRPDEVIFGSTLVKPSDDQKSGFQVGTRKYQWMFPSEMEIVLAHLTADDAPMATPAPIFALPNYDAECSFSSDGRFVLYTHVEDRPKDLPEGTPHRADGNIYIYDTVTRSHHAIVVAPGYDGGPFFSPDGKSICYRSDRAGNDLLQIFVADLRFEKDSGGSMIPVGVEREYQLTNNEHVNWCPYWHPSGKYLVYGTSEVGHFNYEVFAIGVDREAMSKAAETTIEGQTVDATSAWHARVTHAPGADILPAFSTDGTLMMWTAQRGADGKGRPSSQLWITRWRVPSSLTPRDVLQDASLGGH